MPPPTTSRLPLVTLLSQVLVAYTIEFDNLAELDLSHHTATTPDPEGAPTTPFLVSYVCWANVLQYVGPDGITVAELRRAARTDQLLFAGLKRWRYLRYTPAGAQSLKNPPTGDTRVRTTRHGAAAQEIWRGLPETMDRRWRARFGDGTVEDLHATSAAVFRSLPLDPPDYLPITHPTQNGKVRATSTGTRPSHVVHEATDDLPTLIAGVLFGLTVEVESVAALSMPVSLNTLRVLDPDRPLPVRDLPRLTGVSKEANAMCIGFLARREVLAIEPDTEKGRGKVVRLTAKGVRAQSKAARILADTEVNWRSTVGAQKVDALRRVLEPLVGDGTLAHSPLAPGLEPGPGNWRARARPPATLPHYAMVLHRGGFPDGS